MRLCLVVLVSVLPVHSVHADELMSPDEVAGIMKKARELSHASACPAPYHRYEIVSEERRLAVVGVKKGQPGYRIEVVKNDEHPHKGEHHFTLSVCWVRRGESEILVGRFGVRAICGDLPRRVVESVPPGDVTTYVVKKGNWGKRFTPKTWREYVEEEDADNWFMKTGEYEKPRGFRD